ncbi:MAG: YhcH/YjgK/YiaL family protein [Balneolaceae bacterium]|nr:YhcH/YjgK/YiaL family protein [Balneolaceae bacterium]MBO6546932.1 YhcH/YjgK/YiaL family protein [Balneolaceae bacterium]MBO6649292.1 YhcH/YjgK/YiaL family protein [Balneolaceae bacterium]
MIVDTIKNIDLYKGLSEDVYTGLEYIRDVNPDIALGEYQVSENVKAIVSEYETIENFERGYEAHKHVIDIQYPLKGLERVKWSPIQDMEVNIPYDENKDRTFYKKPHPQATYVDIGSGIFAIMFPEDGHGPQHFVNEPLLIKKLTMKIAIKFTNE